MSSFAQMKAEREHRKKEGDKSADALREGRQQVDAFIRGRRPPAKPPEGGDMNAWLRSRGRSEPEEDE